MRVTPGEAGSALCDLPSTDGWDFGGLAYALEPLVLPPAGAFDPSREPGGHTPGGYAEVVEHLRALAAGDPLAVGVDPCPEQDELYWFRWITGHQVCFIVWHLIGALIEDVACGRRVAGDIVEPISRCVDAYSAMLLYTGSCPPDLYNVLIRPSMRLRHRAFSGGWAPDYWPIRSVFRRRRLPIPGVVDPGRLPESLALLDLVHDGVAARLVTSGRSLLREAASRGPGQSQAWMLFDSYFATLRAPVPTHEITTQLLRRVVAIAQDLAANGLYGPGGIDARPAELLAPEVRTCEDGITRILADVTGCATDGPAVSMRPAAPAGPLRPAVANYATEA